MTHMGGSAIGLFFYSFEFHRTFYWKKYDRLASRKMFTLKMAFLGVSSLDHYCFSLITKPKVSASNNYHMVGIIVIIPPDSIFLNEYIIDGKRTLR